MEKWKQIPNWPYEASSEGLIRSLVTHTILSTQNNHTCLSRGEEKWNIEVSRLIAELFIPNPDNLPFVEHINNDYGDNRVENLRWTASISMSKGTIVEKIRDSTAKRCGVIYCYGPQNQEFTCRTYREAAELSGVHRNSIAYAVKKGTTPHGWRFFRDAPD